MTIGNPLALALLKTGRIKEYILQHQTEVTEVMAAKDTMT
jgi:hypothetical protein